MILAVYAVSVVRKWPWVINRKRQTMILQSACVSTFLLKILSEKRLWEMADTGSSSRKNRPAQPSLAQAFLKAALPEDYEGNVLLTFVSLK
jgi:uncharacterized protein involved in type VI secretion and phage assembly